LSLFWFGLVGAGFFIGIRMISEWYPAKQLFLDEPKGSMAEIMPDGSVQLIEIH